MAGEKLGALYELITKEALCRAYGAENIHGQLVIEGSLIKSDFVVSLNKQNLLVLVTHAGTETKTTQKFYRDISEVLQARDRDPNVKAAAVIFDNNTLQQLSAAEKELFGTTIIAGNLQEFKTLPANLEKELEPIQVGSRGDLSEVCNYVNETSKLAIYSLCERLTQDFPSLESYPEGKLRPIYVGETADSRGHGKSYFYSACAQLMLLQPDQRDRYVGCVVRKYSIDWTPKYFQDICSLVGVSVRESSIAVSWLSRHFDLSEVISALSNYESHKSPRYRQMLLLGDYADLLFSHLKVVANSTELMHEILVNESTRAEIAQTVLGDQAANIDAINWVFTLLSSAERVRQGKKMAFGAKRIGEITGNRRYIVQNSIISDYECNQIALPIQDTHALANFFATTTLNFNSTKGEIRSRVLNDVFKDKIGPHSVHPVPAYLRYLSNGDLQYEWISTSFAELAGMSGNAGRVRVLSFNTGEGPIIWWRSAHDGNEAHKAKEVGARIFGLSTTAQGNPPRLFTRGREVHMIVDGDFTNDQIAYFFKSGAKSVVRPQYIEDVIRELR